MLCCCQGGIFSNILRELIFGTAVLRQLTSRLLLCGSLTLSLFLYQIVSQPGSGDSSFQQNNYTHCKKKLQSLKQGHPIQSSHKYHIPSSFELLQNQVVMVPTSSINAASANSLSRLCVVFHTSSRVTSRSRNLSTKQTPSAIKVLVCMIMICLPVIFIFSFRHASDKYLKSHLDKLQLSHLPPTTQSLAGSNTANDGSRSKSRKIFDLASSGES